MPRLRAFPSALGALGVALALGAFACEDSSPRDQINLDDPDRPPPQPDAGPGSSDGGDAGSEPRDSGPVMGMSCADGRVFCGDRCVNTTNDPRHCGRCDMRCPEGNVCTSSRSAPRCVENHNCQNDPCTGFSFCDLGSMQCRAGCVRDDQCGRNETCNLGRHDCDCTDGNHRCGGLCVSEDALATCGGRCDPCPSDSNGSASCENRQCRLACNSGYHLCDGHCALSSSPMSCGASCSPCPADPNGRSTCDGNQCGIECNSGFHLCGGHCVTNDSPITCGNRCNACPSDSHGQATCENAMQCGISCSSGFRFCGSYCTLCPPGAASVTCSGSQCIASDCPSGSELCQNMCATCPSGAGISGYRCMGSACAIASCSDGYRLCAGACASCPSGPAITAVACGTGATCVATACRPGYRLINGACVAWQIETVVSTGVIGSNGGSVGIAIGPTGSPHIAYYTNSGGIALKEALMRNGVWVSDNIQSPVQVRFTNDAALSFAINSAGQEFCGYYTNNDTHLGMLARGFWEYLTPASETGEAIEGTISVALDSAGHPGIAYVNARAGMTPRIEYTFYPNGPLAIQDGGYNVYATSQTVEGAALAYDMQNAPHVVFYDHSALRHAWKVGPLFSNETIDSVAERGYNPSIAIDSGNRIHVAYHSRGGALLYSRKNPVQSWTSPAIVDSSTDPFVFGSDCKIKIGPNGPVIAYHDGSANGSLKYASWNGAGWTLGVVAQGGAGFYSALGFDSSGQLHFAFVVDTGGSVALKYAH